MRIVGGFVFQSHMGEPTVCLLDVVRRWGSIVRQQNVTDGGEPRHETRFLKNIADALLRRDVMRDEVIGLGESRKNVEQGGFAATRRAQHTQKFTACHRQLQRGEDLFATDKTFARDVKRHAHLRHRLI